MMKRYNVTTCRCMILCVIMAVSILLCLPVAAGQAGVNQEANAFVLSNIINKDTVDSDSGSLAFDLTAMSPQPGEAEAQKLALAISALPLQAQEKVELTGTYQVQVICADTYHVETAFVVVPGKDKFSGKRHALKLAPEMKRKLKIGDKVTVRGSKQPAKKLKMSKGQIRKEMVEVIQQGKGIPLQAAEMSGIMGDIQVEAPAKANAAAKPHAHAHGKLKLKSVADDHEMIEIRVIEHIAVEHIELNPGFTQP